MPEESLSGEIVPFRMRQIEGPSSGLTVSTTCHSAKLTAELKSASNRVTPLAGAKPLGAGGGVGVGCIGCEVGMGGAVGNIIGSLVACGAVAAVFGVLPGFVDVP